MWVLQCEYINSTNYFGSFSLFKSLQEYIGKNFEMVTCTSGGYLFRFADLVAFGEVRRSSSRSPIFRGSIAQNRVFDKDFSLF